MLRSKVHTYQSFSSANQMQAVTVGILPCGSTLRTAVQHHHLRQQHNSRVRLCTAVPRSNSSTNSSSRVQQLQQHSSTSSSSSSLQPLSHSKRFSSIRRHVMPPLAMVNVDFASPSLVLGVTLIGCGVALLQVRNMQREVSRDADIVVAAMISIVGSTLIFQGWRLDPLLLLCQALTTSVAFWYGLEAFKLRAEVVQEEDNADMNMNGQQLPPLQDMPGMQQPDIYNAARPGYLPPGAERPAPWAQQQQQQQQGAGGYGPSSGARWGLPPGQQSVPYDAFARSSNGVGMGAVPEGAYAGYDSAAAGSSGQQQQYIPGAGGYGSGEGGYASSPYDAAGGAGMYSAQQPGQQQQPPQYEWPQGSYPQPGMGNPYMQQQQPVWYDAAGVPTGGDPAGGQPQQQLPYAGLPGLVDPYSPVTMPVGGVEALPDGALLPGGYGADSAGLPLPPPADGQQQQQQGRAQTQPRRGQQGGGRNAYEQVDDWE